MRDLGDVDYPDDAGSVKKLTEHSLTSHGIESDAMIIG